jgi:hypothetical protein
MLAAFRWLRASLGYLRHVEFVPSCTEKIARAKRIDAFAVAMLRGEGSCAALSPIAMWVVVQHSQYGAQRVVEPRDAQDGESNKFLRLPHLS